MFSKREGHSTSHNLFYVATKTTVHSIEGPEKRWDSSLVYYNIVTFQTSCEITSNVPYSSLHCSSCYRVSRVAYWTYQDGMIA